MLWFTSDLHFGHANIIRYCNRPWDDVDAMNQGLVDRWNRCVSDNDLVYVLGDLCWGAPSTFLPYLEQLNGDKLLVPGNHDTCWDGHSRPKGREALRKAGFEVLDGTIRVSTPDWGALACHFPYYNPEYPDEKFDQYKPRDHGDWLLHGHIHTLWQTNGRMINVGTDVWDWYPIPEPRVMDLMKEG